MRAKILALAAAITSGFAGASIAYAHPPRGYFGDYNEFYFYGRPPIQYYQSASRGAPMPAFANPLLPQRYPSGRADARRSPTPQRGGYIR